MLWLSPPDRRPIIDAPAAEGCASPLNFYCSDFACLPGRSRFRTSPIRSDYPSDQEYSRLTSIPMIRSILQRDEWKRPRPLRSPVWQPVCRRNPSADHGDPRPSERQPVRTAPAMPATRQAATHLTMGAGHSHRRRRRDAHGRLHRTAGADFYVGKRSMTQAPGQPTTITTIIASAIAGETRQPTSGGRPTPTIPPTAPLIAPAGRPMARPVCATAAPSPDEWNGMEWNGMD